jgi:sarcosine oxidase
MLRHFVGGVARGPEERPILRQVRFADGGNLTSGGLVRVIDVIIVGLGAMGSAAAYQLAQRGKRVVGLERFTPAHDKGSSHGGSRMIRQAYFEDPAYVPILIRAYELWERLGQDTRTNLLHLTGGVMIGSPSSPLITGSIRSAREYQLPHEVLDRREIQRRFPPLIAAAGEVALYESRAGYLLPEECVRQQLGEAARYGADLHFEEPIKSWTAHNRGEGVTVTTGKGTHRAQHLIVSCGAWAPQLLADLELPLVVTRQVMFWLDPIGGIEPFLPDRFPVYMCAPEHGYILYGFPSIDGKDGGVKVAIHGSDEVCTPDSIDREVRETDVAGIRARLVARIPVLNGALLKARTCMYTVTPDENFVICKHPRYSAVTIAAGFSGHGFKMASVVGEILAELVTEGTTRHNIELFSYRRFNSPQG